MITTAVDHYNQHLGPLYLWMVGDIDAALRRSGAELDALHLPAANRRAAVDLGAGFGLHALPLARRGFSVVAIDTCEPLLKELAARRGPLPIRTVNADLLGFRAHLEMPVDVILCMGDTLTHLPNQSCVASLLGDAASSLNSGGLFVATFRDYVTTPLQGDARFILVRADSERILTCFLEYAEATVAVHDVFHQREGEAWLLRVSSYPKLRLSPEWVVERLSSLGLAVRRDTASGGMVRIAAAKPGPPVAVETGRFT